jgi:hypothetical protein
MVRLFGAAKHYIKSHCQCNESKHKVLYSKGFHLATCTLELETSITLPIKEPLSIGPHALQSLLAGRLSPNKKYPDPTSQCPSFPVSQKAMYGSSK